MRHNMCSHAARLSLERSEQIAVMQSLFAQFQTRYPSGGLVTELLTIHDGNYVVKALVNVGDRAIATGMAAAPTIEAAEDQARLRALQVFNQLSNPIALTESPALTPQFLPPGLPLQPSLPNPAAANISVSPHLHAATAASISPPPNVAANTATSHDAQSDPSPVVPVSMNGAAGMASTPSASAPQPIASPAAQPAKVKDSTSSNSPTTSVADPSDWSVDLPTAPDSTLPTNFSITSVSAKPSPKPVADLYAAATEESEEDAPQPWEPSFTPDLNQPESSNFAVQNDHSSDDTSDDRQAIPFFGDDPLEPDFPAEDFAPPMADEAAASAKATKTKPPKSAKSTKTSLAKTAANPAPVNQVVDRSDEIAQIDVEMRRLGWSKQDGRKHLEETYNKRSRQQLTDDELLAFLAYLQTQPSPSQSPF